MKSSPRLPSFRPVSHQFAYSCLIIAFTFTIFGGSHGCFKSENSKNYGTTYPLGDIILLIGQPLELFCIIDVETARSNNFSIENLIFVKENQPVDSRYVTRVNETTIRLYMENQTESHHMYYCYLQKNQSIETSSNSSLNSLEVTTGATAADPSQLRELVCMNWVAVGQEPREVENITCISENWQYLKCSWDVPKNYVPTTYSIYYTPKHRASEKVVCPSEDDVIRNSCTWSLWTKPIYRKTFETLRITVNGTNKFKSHATAIIFNQFAHILMDGPKDLKLLAKNTTSVTLQWDIGDLQYFPKPLQFKILYKWNNESAWDMVICDAKKFTRDGRLVSCTVSDLIPNKVYNFRVFMKSSLASDKYWSKNFTYQLFATNACPPARSPLTDIGSFQLEHNDANRLMRTVYVYWQPLLVEEQCGDNFTYEITTFEMNIDGTESAAANVKRIGAIDNSFAKYEIGSSRYRFEIRSVNKEGRAPSTSSVVVPAVFEEVDTCSRFTKTDYGNTDDTHNMYEVSWQPPVSGQIVDNYTIFWCKSEKERPYQCNGYLEWESFTANVSKHNFSININDSYQFAISANTQRSSSGMHWASCTVLRGHLGTVRQVYARETGSTYIAVSWKLECPDQASSIQGFEVTYCPTVGLNTTVCAGTNQTLRWEATANQGNISGLQPFTHYAVTMRMFNADGNKGPISTPVILRTADGPPNVDGLKLKLMNRTNTSVTVGWEVPRQMNGVLSHYLVQWHPQQEPKRVDTTQATITKLDPYTKYNVTVKACTSSCSRWMTPIEVGTGIGKPGKIDLIVVEPQDHGTMVRWDPPSQLAGPHPYYEVHLLKDNFELFVNKTNDTYTWMMKPDCSSDQNAKYEVRVRAINLDDKKDIMDGAAQLPSIYEGDKSPAFLLKCTDGVSILWKILLWTTLPVLLMVFVGYSSNRLFKKFRMMKEVEVKVPLKFSPHVCGDSNTLNILEGNYVIAQPLRSADESSMLVEKTAEQPV